MKKNGGIAELVCVVVVGLAATVCPSVAARAVGETTGQQKLVNAVYVFGDSLVDVGNNDYLPAPAPWAHAPYGFDLPGRPTGRFTNGYNIADYISYRMGFDLSPPAYMSMLLHEKVLLVTCNIGANYASGGSGILDTTGNGTLTMTTQIKYFKRAVDKMMCLPSKEAMLAQSLFLLSGGGNDFSAFTGPIGDAPANIAKMVSTYIGHIQDLYNLGARMVGILDVPPIGCTPGQRVLMPNGECNEVANTLARWFNSLLRIELAGKAAAYMRDLKYSIANNYNILNDMMANPLVAGIREVHTACCGAGKFMGEKMCGDPGTTMCADNHDEYMFWDMLHATEATVERGSLALFHGGVNYADPVNFRTLVTQKKVSRLAPKQVANE
ncbi:hypothetical protein ACQ4PT_057086 [Festuca glaucescens]